VFADFAMLTMHEVYEVDGAPVVNMFSAALKMAESMVALKKAYGPCVQEEYLPRSPCGLEAEIPITID